MEHKTSTSWRETIGLVDAVVELHEPSSQRTWVDRYGKTKHGNEYVFSVKNEEADLVHEQIIIADSEVGMQSYGYDVATNRFNEITYLPAYRFTRAAGGLSLASVVISLDGEMVIPVIRTFSDMLKVEDVIDDLHKIMGVV